MTKDWQPHAQHVLDAIARIHRIEQRGSIVEDEVLYDAVLRNLQTLSEVTQHLPLKLKAKHPSIPWREISGFRNILVHNYLGGIDADSVAAVIKRHLAPLKRAIEVMLQGDQ